MTKQLFKIESTELFKYYSEIKKDIEMHRLYLSEKAGHDVGKERAFIDWLIFQAPQDEKELKKKYKTKKSNF